MRVMTRLLVIVVLPAAIGVLAIVAICLAEGIPLHAILDCLSQN